MKILDQFVKDLLIRVGPKCFDDPIKALTRLRQTGSAENYKTQFETLSNKLRALSNPYKLSCFLSELWDDIRLPMRMFNPMNLISAYSFAKKQEEKLYLANRNQKGGSTLHTYFSPIHNKLPKLNLLTIYQL